MSTLSDPARDPGRWRACVGCGTPAALPSRTDLCPDCQPDPDAHSATEPTKTVPTHTRPSSAVPLRAEHFTANDLMDVWLAGGTLAAAIEDISQHYIGEPGTWDCYGEAPDELARLSDALDGMEAAVHRSRTALNRVERRVRARAARASSREPRRVGPAREERSA